MVLVSSFDSARYMWRSLNFMIKVASTLTQIKAFLELPEKYVQGYKQAHENYSDFIDFPSWHPVPRLSQIRCRCTLRRCHFFGFIFPSTTAFLAVNRGCKTRILSHSERTSGKRHCPHRLSCHNFQEVPGTTAF